MTESGTWEREITKQIYFLHPLAHTRRPLRPWIHSARVRGNIVKRIETQQQTSPAHTRMDAQTYTHEKTQIWFKSRTAKQLCHITSNTTNKSNYWSGFIIVHHCIIFQLKLVNKPCTMNPLYNAIRYNSKIRHNVNSVCTKISGSCVFPLIVLKYSLGKHTFWIFVKIVSPWWF